MKQAITNYFRKLEQQYPNYYKNSDFADVSVDIKESFCRGTRPIKRSVSSDISCFEKKYGYMLPQEICCYINDFWHPYVMGYCKSSECIVLFSVLKKEGDSNDDILYYKNSLMPMAEEWNEVGDIQMYIPIGWLGYSGGYVLYEVKTQKIFLEDMEADYNGVITEKPIANCMKELINNMEIKC